MNQMEKPNIQGLDQLDTAVLLQKMVVLNGMLHYGTAEEKLRARMEFKQLQPIMNRALNLAAMEQAKQELSVSEEEISNTKSSPLY
ncbi:hypothetical protein [Metabacillus fastidiosus]|uniref:Spore coat protein n=1 Tax=Metabacillus fastidiosus TaxID=1458 RepID=A0ABU6P5M2_9BACI|nr:hypothetical protein [Metabacillus fastidiosus]MED4404223.1 hypothetical protein [Metabacillus fastidiosus]